MDFETAMRNALTYIEDHLCGEIDYEALARTACCSSYHFQRMFSYVVGIPLAEYIRRRRMTLAAFDLRRGSAKVIDIALKYGYDSQSAFARAFQQFHGVTPTAARRDGVKVRAYPQISFQFIIRGADIMDYRIVSTEPFSMFGVAIQLTPDDAAFSNIFDRLGRYAEEVLENGSHEATNAMAGNPPMTLLDSIRYDFQDDGSCKFMFAAQKPDKEIGAPFTVLEIPAKTWAVFEYRKDVIYPETPEPLYRQIYWEWFPTSGYEQDEGPCLEKYYPGICEAWIPVRKRADHGKGE